MSAADERGAAIPVTVEGRDLPGRGHGNFHVGLCDRSWRGDPVVAPHRPWGVVGVLPGDAPTARWDVEVMVKETDAGLDFGGRFVRGKRGGRHLALAWGELSDDHTFALFRVAKLALETIDPSVVRQAAEPGARLVARLGLTDAKGDPRCATVLPPDLVWAVERA